MKKESKLSSEQLNYIENLKLIMEKREIKRKTLEEEIPEVHGSNLSNAFNYKRPISEANSRYIAEYLGESVLDMQTEGYARKKYYTAGSIDLIELLRSTPYYEVVMKLILYYMVSCVICTCIANFKEYTTSSVLISVTMTWFIVVFGDSMRKVTNCHIEIPVLRNFLELINGHKYASVILLSVLEMFICSQTYYESFMQLLLTLLFVESSGIFSKNMVEESKKKVKGYLGTRIFIRVMEFFVLCAYCIDVYVKLRY